MKLYNRKENYKYMKDKNKYRRKLIDYLLYHVI